LKKNQDRGMGENAVEQKGGPQEMGGKKSTGPRIGHPVERSRGTSTVKKMKN